MRERHPVIKYQLKGGVKPVESLERDHHLQSAEVRCEWLTSQIVIA